MVTKSTKFWMLTSFRLPDSKFPESDNELINIRQTFLEIKAKLPKEETLQALLAFFHIKLEQTPLDISIENEINSIVGYIFDTKPDSLFSFKDNLLKIARKSPAAARQTLFLFGMYVRSFKHYKIPDLVQEFIEEILNEMIPQLKNFNDDTKTFKFMGFDEPIDYIYPVVQTLFIFHHFEEGELQPFIQIVLKSGECLISKREILSDMEKNGYTNIIPKSVINDPLKFEDTPTNVLLQILDKITLNEFIFKRKEIINRAISTKDSKLSAAFFNLMGKFKLKLGQIYDVFNQIKFEDIDDKILSYIYQNNMKLTGAMEKDIQPDNIPQNLNLEHLITVTNNPIKLFGVETIVNALEKSENIRLLNSVASEELKHPKLQTFEMWDKLVRIDRFLLSNDPEKIISCFRANIEDPIPILIQLASNGYPKIFETTGIRELIHTILSIDRAENRFFSDPEFEKLIVTNDNQLIGFWALFQDREPMMVDFLKKHTSKATRNILLHGIAVLYDLEIMNVDEALKIIKFVDLLPMDDQSYQEIITHISDTKQQTNSHLPHNVTEITHSYIAAAQLFVMKPRNPINVIHGLNESNGFLLATIISFIFNDSARPPQLSLVYKDNTFKKYIDNAFNDPNPSDQLKELQGIFLNSLNAQTEPSDPFLLDFLDSNPQILVNCPHFNKQLMQIINTIAQLRIPGLIKKKSVFFSKNCNKILDLFFNEKVVPNFSLEVIPKDVLYDYFIKMPIDYLTFSCFFTMNNKFISDHPIISDVNIAYVLNQLRYEQNWEAYENMIQFAENSKHAKTVAEQLKSVDLPEKARKIILSNLDLNEVDNEYFNGLVSIEDLLDATKEMSPKGINRPIIFGLADTIFRDQTNVTNSIMSYLEDYLVFREKDASRFCITLNKLALLVSNFYNNSPKELFIALKKLYTLPSNANTYPESEKILFLRVNPFPPDKTSLEMLEKLQVIIQITKQGPTWQLLYLLTYICHKYISMFEDIENNEELFEMCTNIFHESFTFGSLDEYYLMNATIGFLAKYISNPKILDKFLNWFFPRINSFSVSIIFIILIILEGLRETPCQKIYNIYLIKYRWDLLAIDLMQKKFENNHFLNASYTSRIIKYTKDYYRMLNKLNPKWAAITSSLIDSNEIFTEVFKHHSRIPMFNIKKNVEFFKRQIPFMTNTKIDQSLNYVQNLFGISFQTSRFKKYKNDMSKFNENIIKIYKTREPIDLTHLPKKIKPKPFQQLSTKAQSTILYHSFPKVPRFTPPMHEILVRQPSWVYGIFHQCKIPSLLLPPSHYMYLAQVVQQMKEIEKKEVKSPLDIAIESYTNTGIIDIMISKDILSANFDLLPIKFFKSYVKKNLSGYEYVLRKFNEILPSISTPEVIRVFRILQNIRKKAIFTEIDFFEKLIQPSILDNILNPSFRKDLGEKFKNTEYMFYFGENVPLEYVQIIIFILLSNNANDGRESSRSIEMALNTIATLPKDVQSLLTPYIRTILDQMIDTPSPNKSHNYHMLPKLLKSYPEEVSAKQTQLLKILQDLLSNYTHKELSIIGAICDVLCPERKAPKPLYETQTQTQDQIIQSQKNTINIPKHVFALYPEFWQIISDNADIISRILKENKTILNSELKFLRKFPELLSFKQKTNWFKYQQHQKIFSHHYLKINVRRSHILMDSYSRLHSIKPHDFLGSIRVFFADEEGIDAGGLKVDWFTNLAKEMFNPDYALFTPSANKRSYQPNPNSYVNHEHIQYFKFAGRIIARSLIEGVHLDAHLSTFFMKHILDWPLNLRDLEDIDEDLHKSLKWILENEVEGIDMQFVADDDEFGQHKEVELKPDGRNINITDENKAEYVTLMVEHRLKRQSEQQIQAFCDGFYELIPLDEIRIFLPNELDLLICGVPTIDVSDFQKNCEYNMPYHASHSVVLLFFNVIRTWNNENLAKLLLFITGSSQVPIGGFKALRNSNHPLTIAPGGPRERLPVAHTCMNTLDLPEYENEEELQEKLIYSISECNTFGFS